MEVEAEPEEPPPKPKRKKPKSMISLDSYIRKKETTKIDLPDYDRRVSEELADENGMYSVAGGYGSLAGIKYSDGHIYEPEEADLAFGEAHLNEGINPLSYKSVKRWQYKYHPRDRKLKEKFHPVKEDISFLPLSMC